MELRPYAPTPASLLASMSPGQHPPYRYSGGMVPGLRTVRPEDIMRPPTVYGSTSSRTESIDASSGYGGSRQPSSGYRSDIMSYITPDQARIVVPPTNSGNRPSPIAIQPQYNSSISSGSRTTHSIPYSSPSHGHGQLIPSSLNHRKPPAPTPSSTIPSLANSSPAPAGAIPSHISSTELSSNRPLFSSPQGSSNGNAAQATPADSWSRVPPVLKTYGRSSNKSTPSPTKKIPDTRPSEPIQLSLSPPSARPSPPPEPRKKATTIVEHLSDEDDEEQEQVELRLTEQLIRSRVEVVLPARPVSTGKKDKQKESPAEPLDASRDEQLDRRAASPDPLDVLHPDHRTPAKARRPSSVIHPSSSALTTASQGESIGESSRRASSRVADNKLKEEQAKEERRRKRREEKERKRLEEEARARPKDKRAERSPAKATTVSVNRRRVMSEDDDIVPLPQDDIMNAFEVEESVVEIPAPVAELKTAKKRKSEVVEEKEAEDDFDPALGGQVSKKDKSKPTPKGKKGKKAPSKKAKKAEATVVEAMPETEIELEPFEEVDDKAEKPAAVTEEVVAEQAVVDVADEPMAEEDQEQQPAESLSPAKSPSPVRRPPLRPTSSNISTPSASYISNRPSPGPAKPDGSPALVGGIKWKAPRNDLSSLLAKFGGAKRSGMSNRLKIVPLHQKIGPPAKVLPPAPKKPEKKKKGDVDSDEDEDEEVEYDVDGNVIKKPKDGKKSLEWFMMED
ncbi:hypothetical protein IAU60_005670 [Kwoniella sp. DSM 27419]